MCLSEGLRVCLLQFASQENLAKTLAHLEELVSKAVSEYQPQIIALPECFNFAYCSDSAILERAAESIDGETCHTLSKLSKHFDLYIVGGSIIERDGVKLYNTCTVWNPNGELIARYSKIHLSDTESAELGKFTAGDDIITFEVNSFKCGIAICYDAMFDEFFKIYAKLGCDLILCPAAFEASPNGDGLWELIYRTRAMDNQFFIAAINPARDEQASYVSHGYSMVIDPKGKILAQAKTSEQIVFYEIDHNEVQKIRKQNPLFASRRTDVYKKYLEN